jgi:hypothetical protein
MYSQPQQFFQVSGQLHAPATLTMGEKAAGTYWMEG